MEINNNYKYFDQNIFTLSQSFIDIFKLWRSLALFFHHRRRQKSFTISITDKSICRQSCVPPSTEKFSPSQTPVFFHRAFGIS